MGMRLDISSVNFSRNDMEKGLRLPETLTTELAEDIGIMVGDGCICYRENKNEHEISVVGHIITDEIFVKNHTRRLKKKLFDINFRFTRRLEINTCLLRTYSKGLFEFYTKIIGLPVGSKREAGIPNIIKNNNNDIKKAFLKGLADTDMTLVFKRAGKDNLRYPVIKLGTASKNLVLDVRRILEDIGFKPSICCDMRSYHTKTKKTYTTNQLYLNGEHNLNKWVKEIGFSNPKNILRFKLWKKNGFSLPNKEIEIIMSGPGGIYMEKTIN